MRLNITRYWGSNNVLLDPASPLTFDANNNNGEEVVSTETASLSLTSGLSQRWISHFRAQFSRDLQQSYSNTSASYPGYYTLQYNFMKPNAAYAPRQIQLALKFIY